MHEFVHFGTWANRAAIRLAVLLILHSFVHYFYSLTLDYTLNYQGKVYFLVVACIKIVRYIIFYFLWLPHLYPEPSHISLRMNLQIAHGFYAIYLSL